MVYGEMMIGNATVMNTPVLWINKYLADKIPLLSGLEDFPFFPSTPSTINDLTEYFSYSEQQVAATWDRLIKMNKKGFPHIKCEQLMYYFYAQGTDPVANMIKIQESVLRLMDRFDETAEEINAWCANRSINIGTAQSPEIIDNQFYFHNFKVYQLEETRDIIDFGTARTYGGNKIIIDFDYHQMPDLINTEGPESRLATKIII
jgi:hypothetical protein